MYNHHLGNRSTNEPFNYQVSIPKNPIGIGEINYIWDQSRKHLVALMKSDQKFNTEVNASLKGHWLILVQQQNLAGIELEPQDGLYSEIELKPGFDYKLISSECIDPSLFKVTLTYRSLMKKMNN